MNDYPERLGYKMLADLESKSLKTLNTKLLNLGNDNTKMSKDDIQLNMAEVHRKYCNPSNVDRVYEIQSDVNVIQKEMKRNVREMMKNVENASVLIT